jgi:hypothetical protein
MEDEANYRISVANAQEDCGWSILVRNYLYGLSRKVFQLPTGEMFVQTTPGIQASGTYITSSANSHMRHMMASIVQQRLGHFHFDSAFEGCQMGDDALERHLDGLEADYTALGFRVKGVSKCEDGTFSFCSTSWKGEPFGSPESWKKTLLRFLVKKPSTTPEYTMWRNQLANDLRHLPGLREILVRVDSYIHARLAEASAETA